MSTSRPPRPDALLIGAPKAGTSALHAALARHPGVFTTNPKEPKYFLCTDSPPPAYRGPGDSHSSREWVWRREDYERLFVPAPGDSLRIESTPFYLYQRNARRRIAEELPDARLVVVVRDPVDRAYSNWMHLWSDGLEPIPDFVAACGAEDDRIRAGYAPFWHYRAVGRYGEQLQHLLSVFDPAQVHVLRYRDLVDRPDATLDGICAFLGVEAGLVAPPAPENTRPFVPDTPRTRALARLVRAGAQAGAQLPPQVWRRASRPLVSALQRGGTPRPRLSPGQRREVLGPLVADVHLLEQVTGQSFADWLTGEGRGEFSARRAEAVAGAAAPERAAATPA